MSIWKLGREIDLLASPGRKSITPHLIYILPLYHSWPAQLSSRGPIPVGAPKSHWK